MRGVHDASAMRGDEDGRGFGALIESSPLGIICLDLRGNVTMWNAAAERIFGWSRHEVFGRALPTIPQEKRDEYRAMLPDILVGGEITEFEALCQKKSGERITVSISVAPLRDLEGDVEGCMGMVLDVTERKRAERELEESNQRLAQVFDQSVEALFIHDEEGEILDCNAEARRSLGYSREEMLRMNVGDFAGPPPNRAKGREEKENPIWRAFISGEREGVAFSFAEHRRRDGASFPVEVRVGAVDYGGGKMILASARDVTEREEATREMSRLGRRNQLVLDSVGEGIYGVDREMKITFANPAVSRLTGHEAPDLIGQSSHALFHHTKPGGEPYPLSECRIFKTVQAGETQRLVRETLWKKDGTSFPIEYSCAPIQDDGEVTGAVIVFRDVTERRKSERLLQEREKRFRVLFQNASDVILISDESRVIRYASPSCERVMGYRPETLVGTSLFDYVHPEDEEKVDTSTSEALKKSGVSRTLEFRWRHADGSWRSQEAIGNNLLREPSIRGLILNVRDVTERKMLEDQLTHQAFHDSLTGLPNRNLFMDRVEQALRRAKRRNKAVATLFMDLDNFKIVNDTLGHEFGDRLLTGIAGRLKRCLRLEDTAARFGGDEFTVLLEDISGEEAAVRVAQRISAALAEPFKLAGREVFITTSIGVSLNIFGTEEPQDLLRHADIAVYHAKERGRNRQAVFEPGMNALAMEQMVLGNDLKRALEREEFVLLYQPKVLLLTGEISAVEALLYWDHPERGRLSPQQFIPLAEETGMISAIGRWVLHEACRQTRLWRDSPQNTPTSISVNLSVVQLRSRKIVEDVREALEETDLASSNLSLEVTESLLIEDVYSVIDVLKELRGLGVGLAIDDFGTGYSSLSTLKNLPIDILKVDKSFIDGLGEGERDAEIVRAVIDLSHTLGMKVTAEGVETREQFELLRKMGCEVAQGFYISRPIPAEEMGELLSSNHRW